MKDFTRPFPGQRVWHRSVDREYDIFEVNEIVGRQSADMFYSSVPYARVYVRRPGRGAGPTIHVGPDHSPFAGEP